MTTILKTLVLLTIFVLSTLAAINVQAGTITDDLSSRRYQESFNSFTVGSIPSDTWYSVNTAGTGIQQVVESGCPNADKCYQISDGSAPYATQIVNLGSGVNLCTNTQSVQFDLAVPDLNTGAVWEYRVSGVPAVAGALPANSLAIRFTGIIGSTNEVRFVVRGSAAAENGGAIVVSTISGGTNVHALISNGNCGGTTASFTFTLTGSGLSIPPTARAATSGDTINIQLNRVGVVNTIGLSGSTAYFDNYDWQGAPLPTVTISDISPKNGFANTAVVISGTGFQDGLTVKVGVQNAAINQVALNEVRITTPYNPPGVATLTVNNPDGTSASTTFTYVEPPIVANCPKRASPTQAGVTFLGDNYNSTPVGGIPDQCWYDFSLSNTDILRVTEDTWANTNTFKLNDGSTFRGFLSPDKKSLYNKPSGSGYNQLNWKVKSEPNGCRNDVITHYFTGFNIAHDARIGIISSADLGELQTPNTGSMYIDVDSGGSSHSIVIVNNDGTTTSSNILFNHIPNQWNFIVFDVVCSTPIKWNFNTNSLEAAWSFSGIVFDSNGNVLRNFGISGDVLKKPSYPLDTLAIHCTGICYQDAFFTYHAISLSKALTYVNCSGTTDKQIRGFDYSGGTQFGIVKVKGPDGVPSCGPSVQIHTFNEDLAYLASPPGFNNFDNPEVCYQDYGVIAYVYNIGICYNDDYPSSAPEDEQHCLYIRTRFLDNPPRDDLDYLDEADHLCEENPSTWSQELAAMDRFSIDYDDKTLVCGVELTSVDECTDIGFAFSEANQGIMGAYVEFFENNENDAANSAFIRVAPVGTTVTQLCAFSYGESPYSEETGVEGHRKGIDAEEGDFATDQYIAGIAYGYGIKLARIWVHNAGDTNTRNIFLQEIPISNPAFANAKAIDCAADKIYLLTDNTFYTIRAIARPGAIKGPNVGDVIYQESFTASSSNRLITVNEDSTWVAVATNGVVLYNITNENDINLQGAMGFPSSNNYPSGEPFSSTSTFKLDRQANHLFLSLDYSLFKYDIRTVTHGGRYVQDPNPNQGGASGYQDTDNDFISDIYDPCPNDPDADDDLIIDGNDSEFLCKGVIYDGTILRNCSSPAANCNQSLGPNQPGAIVGGSSTNTVSEPFTPGNNPFGIDVEGTAEGLNISTLSVNILIGLVFMVVMAIWVYQGTESVPLSMLGAFAGLIVGTVMGFLPIWIILSVIFVIILIVGSLFFGGKDSQ